MRFNFFTQLLTTFFLLLFFVSGISAQVTIGSREAPVQGAVLQLKENNNSDINSTRGLMLPHVELKDLNSLADIDSDNPDRPDPNAHIGLMVYFRGQTTVNVERYDVNSTPSNVVPELIVGRYYQNCQGVYAWNGQKWNNMFYDEREQSPIETNSTLTDTDGNVYTIHTFGSAGTWMTQNLRRVTSVYCGTDSMRIPRTNKVAFQYPNERKELFEQYPEYGLLYSVSVISGMFIDIWSHGRPLVQMYRFDDPRPNMPDGSLQPGTADPYVAETIRAICPKGWHIPTDTEWTKLERELCTNRSAYSSEVTGMAWDPEWENPQPVFYNDNYFRGDYGLAMVNPTIPEGASADILAEGTTHGTSNTDGTGFNAYLLGYYEKNFISSFPVSYGTKAYFASVNRISFGSGTSYMMRALSWGKTSNPNKGTKEVCKELLFEGQNPFVSVRCKKNEW